MVHNVIVRSAAAVATTSDDKCGPGLRYGDGRDEQCGALTTTPSFTTHPLLGLPAPTRTWLEVAI